MVKEVVDPVLDKGQPEEKLQEPYCYGEWMEWQRMKNELPWQSLYRVRDQGLYIEEVLPTEGS
jgi:hypothetical protein